MFQNHLTILPETSGISIFYANHSAVVPSTGQCVCIINSLNFLALLYRESHLSNRLLSLRRVSSLLTTLTNNLTVLGLSSRISFYRRVITCRFSQQLEFLGSIAYTTVMSHSIQD